MKPESLIGITLELIETVALPGDYPADARVGKFFRQRRYLGSRDRRFIGEATYAWLRHQIGARWRWRQWIASLDVALPDDAEVREIEATRAREQIEIRDGDAASSDGDAPVSAALSATKRLRTVYILDLLALAHGGTFPWEFEATASAVQNLRRPEAKRETEGKSGGEGENEAESVNEDEPPREDPAWLRLLEPATSSTFLASTTLPTDPVERFSVEHSLPHWLAACLIEEQEAAHAARLGEALLQPATTDLRVNLRLQNRETARDRLAKDLGVDVELTHFSPLGLRLGVRKNLTASTASKKGWIEVQDEGSQLAVLCTDPAPGMTVIDACAGGGGKTLAIADILFRKEETAAEKKVEEGSIYACDIDRRRLYELERRARESRLEGVVALVELFPVGPLPAGMPQADLVLIDAPCSGLGTLRRNPRLKRRYGPQDVAKFAATQLSILERFAPAVKAGGRLAYVSCSFIRAECEDVAAAFERNHPEFTGVLSSWAATRLPPGCIDGSRIRLDPVRTHTDAFFIATWKKQS